MGQRTWLLPPENQLDGETAPLGSRVANLVPVDNIDKAIAAVCAYTHMVEIYPESLTSLGYACHGSVATPQDAIATIRRMCK